MKGESDATRTRAGVKQGRWIAISERAVVLAKAVAPRHGAPDAKGRLAVVGRDSVEPSNEGEAI
jgi:hypothetical protein